MDRIRRALDLAREERVRPVDVAPAKEPRVEPVRPDIRVVTRMPAPIAYVHTRVFSPAATTLESNRIVNPTDADGASAAFRMLRTQVLQRMDENGWRSIAVLSPGADDGKTTTAINLAVSLAGDQQHTALLVDCDLKRPSVAVRLGITPEFGIDDVLRGHARIDQCLFHPEGFDRFVVLPARSPLENSSEALSSHRGQALAAELRDRYPERIVVYDLPPILGADDALAFLPSVECALVVVAEGSTRREDLLRCMELLRRTPIIGTVLNRASDTSSAYG